MPLSLTWRHGILDLICLSHIRCFHGLLSMLSEYLIGMPKRVTDLLLLRNDGASLTVVHFVALLRLYTSVKLANSQRPFRHGKKDFGLAVIRSPTKTLWSHRTVVSRLAHFGDALRLSRSTKLCWSHLRLRLGILNRQLCVSFPGSWCYFPGGEAT